MAAHRAKQGSQQTTDEQMFGALERAEAEFGRCTPAHAQPYGPHAGPRFVLMVVHQCRQGTAEAQPAGDNPKRAAQPNSTPKKGTGVNDAARQKARERLLRAVQAGKHTFALAPAEQRAVVDRIELSCFEASASRCAMGRLCSWHRFLELLAAVTEALQVRLLSTSRCGCNAAGDPASERGAARATTTAAMTSGQALGVWPVRKSQSSCRREPRLSCRQVLPED